MNVDLLTLPWELQVALAGGYAAYVVAYTGLRARHRTVDVVFITLVFGLIATATLGLLAQEFGRPVWRGATAIAVTVIGGFLWRRWGRDVLAWSLRKFDVSWSDDSPSALETISENSKHPVTQIAVMLDDGTWLRCDDTSKFADSPQGPCIIGPNGDVALYLTHEDPKGDASKDQTTVVDEHWGDRITYIPASRIRYINLRRKRRR